MRTLGIAPIVEGHGEIQSVRILLTRVVQELLGGPFPFVLQPIRRPRNKLVLKEGELSRAIELGVLDLRASWESFERPLVLVMLDADDDLPCELAPSLLKRARRDDIETSCVLPCPEFETWFVAAAPSLSRYLRIEGPIPTEPEAHKLKKAWIQRRFRRGRYSPTIDQPRLTAAMDLAMCRDRSPSFDKLCRELESRL